MEEEVLMGFQAAARRTLQGGLMQLAPWGEDSAHLPGTGVFFRVKEMLNGPGFWGQRDRT